MSDVNAADRQWFGHPRGLSTLFFTEMWERFSFYGLRAMLILFMTAAVTEANPGLGFTDAKAGSILGLYTAGVYLLALPGGWIADRLLGQRRAVFIGGVVIAAGHFSMAVPSLATFYLGLVLIVVGTGLLKPNVSAIVADLYPEGGARRDAGFSVFYMGINIGALFGPLLCGWLARAMGWHWGFGLAGVGMVLGLIQYTLSGKYLGDAGQVKIEPGRRDTRQQDARRFFVVMAVVIAVGVAVGLLWSRGAISVSSEAIATGTGVVILSLVILYFLGMFLFGGLKPVEKKGLAMVAILFLFAAIFWSGFEQASSSMNLFAERLTDRTLGGFEVPTTWLQSVNPLFIIIFAPIFGVLWVKLADRNPSMPAKFSLGLLFLGVGFLVMMWASTYTEAGVKVGMTWLVATYFFHTVGELCLSPVGLSSVTKLAPARLSGQMMGIWFMGTSLGNLIAGILGGQFGRFTQVQLFGAVAAVTIGSGLLLTLVVLGRWTAGALERAEGRLSGPGDEPVVQPPEAPFGGPETTATGAVS